MRVPFRHLSVRMPKDLLDLVDGMARVDQERSELMPKVMKPQVRQFGLYAQSPPDFVHRSQTLAGLQVNEQMGRLTLGVQTI